MLNDRRTGKLIIVGGASGTGKSTLAKSLDQQGIAVYKRIHKFAFNIAEEIRCDVKAVFNQLDRYVPELMKRMIAFTIEHRCAVSDLHFAIQPKADTILLLGGKVSDAMLMEESYRPAFTAKDLAMVTDSNIALIPILIVCDIDELTAREMKTVDKVSAKSPNREIIQKECVAELEIYLSIVHQLGLKPYILRNPNNGFDSFQKQVIALIRRSQTFPC